MSNCYNNVTGTQHLADEPEPNPFPSLDAERSCPPALRVVLTNFFRIAIAQAHAHAILWSIPWLLGCRRVPGFCATRADARNEPT
ncbi:hypothetical protein NITHO_4600002 [Nitrolancea hollandica Lb]|uniref:Uncharacterized protein n=1 Tax=Nitrolancea hollandica Lb TaxID=1129897 RepID=I4EKI8_9BACT|nr:hypothetical protein NITHO_4600002 [Nitrolancea hollandica Lb]